MKLRMYSWYIPLIIPLLFSGCISSNPVPAPTLTIRSSLTPSPVPLTDTPVPNATQTPSLTPPIMLEPEQAEETIRVLLQEPNDCNAPCFWEITPGKTSFGEATNIFSRLRLHPQFTYAEGNRKFYDVDYVFDSGLSIDIILTIQDNIVENLRLNILPEENKTSSPRGWSAYSPETLISRYGEPSRVVFALDWGPRSYFEMDMYFDTVNLIVVYAGYDIIPRQKGSPQICPLTAQFNIVSLWMGENPVSPPSDAIPLEDATDMTLEEFSKLMTGDPNKACFVLKGEVFP